MKQGSHSSNELKCLNDLMAGSIYVFGALGVMYVQRAYEEGDRFNLIKGALHFLFAGAGIVFYITHLSENSSANVELAGNFSDYENNNDYGL
jgi:hypothetical protein